MEKQMENSNKILFNYKDKMFISSSVEETINWINSLPGLMCNEHTKDNLDRIINQEWKTWGYYNQNSNPVNKDGYYLHHLKTTGISTGKIGFAKTNCNSVEEVIIERENYEQKIKNLKDKIAEINDTIGFELLLKLSEKSKSCVILRHHNDVYFSLTIGENGYWYQWQGASGYSYIEESSYKFNAETLLTENGKNVIDIIKNYKSKANVV